MDKLIAFISVCIRQIKPGRLVVIYQPLHIGFKQFSWRLIMTKVLVKEGESIEQALQRFTKECRKSGVMREAKKRKFYKKPSQIKREKEINRLKNIKRKKNKGAWRRWK